MIGGGGRDCSLSGFILRKKASLSYCDFEGVGAGCLSIKNKIK